MKTTKLLLTFFMIVVLAIGLAPQPYAQETSDALEETQEPALPEQSEEPEADLEEIPAPADPPTLEALVGTADALEAVAGLPASVVEETGETVAPRVVEPGEEGAPDELILKDGRVLRDYHIHSWNKTTLTIFHSTGAVNVPAHQLPENVVKAYGMDPQLSLEEEQQSRSKRTEEAVASMQALEKRQAQRKMPTVTVQGSVMTVGAEGVILQVDEPTDLEPKGYQKIGGRIYSREGTEVPEYRDRIFGTVWVTGHPLQDVVVDGDVLRFQGKVAGRRSVEGKTYPSVRFEKAAP